MKLDAIVPFHIKDIGTIEWCLKGLKQNPDIGNIYVVCSCKYSNLVESFGVGFLDENQVVPGLKADSSVSKRWGWYFQQIIKLAMADLVETDYYLVVDADTVFLRPVNFFNKSGKPLYAIGSEYHLPYFKTIKELLNFTPKREYSFIAHHMIFNRHLVIEMREKFKKHEWWFDNILSMANSSNSISLFSEYETYGHFAKEFYPDEINIRQLKWSNFAIEPNEKIIRRLSRYYDYSSFHFYSREKKALFDLALRKFRFELKIIKDNKVL